MVGGAISVWWCVGIGILFVVWHGVGVVWRWCWGVSRGFCWGRLLCVLYQQSGACVVNGGVSYGLFDGRRCHCSVRLRVVCGLGTLFKDERAECLALGELQGSLCYVDVVEVDEVCSSAGLSVALCPAGVVTFAMGTAVGGEY